MKNYVQSVNHNKPEEAINFEVMPNDMSLENILSADIETTGTDPSTSVATILGGTYFDENGVPKSTQFFLKEKRFEKELFLEFAKFLDQFDYVVTFNGNSFDNPYIDAKFEYYGIEQRICKKQGVDLYKWARSYQTKIVKALQNNGMPADKIKKPFGDRLNLKSIEKHFGIEREDTIFGVTMIEKYHQYEYAYVSSKCEDEMEFKIRMALNRDEEVHSIYDNEGMEAAKEYLSSVANDLRDFLLLHNIEDTFNLLKLLGISSSKVFA